MRVSDVGAGVRLAAVLTLIATVLVFPTRVRGLCVSALTGDVVSQVDVVWLSPVFVLGHRTTHNAMMISPNLKDIAAKHPGDMIMLANPDSERTESGVKSRWSFAYGYWACLVVMPCVVLAFAIMIIPHVIRRPRPV